MFLIDIDQYETLLLFVGVFIMTYVYCRRTSTHNDDDGRPPRLTSFPVIGSILSLPPVDRLHVWFLTTVRPKYGSVVAFYLGSRYSVILQSHDVIEEAFLKRSIDFADRRDCFQTKLLNPGLHGIIDRPFDDEFQKYHRLTAAIIGEFGFGKSNVLEDRIAVEVADLICAVGELNGQALDPRRLVNASATNVIASVVFGRRFDRSDPILNDLQSTMSSFVDGCRWTVTDVDAFPLRRFLPSVRRRASEALANHRRWMQIIDSMMKTSLAAGAGRKASSSTAGNTAASFVGRFRELEGPDFDRRELRYIARDLLLTGTALTGATLLWTLVLLADRPDVQRRIQDDVDAVVARRRRRFASVDDRPSLPYVEAVLLEVMRLRTLLPLSVPRQTMRDTQLAGFFIPEKTWVFASIYAAHMDPRVWDDPTCFRPERFLNEHGEIDARKRNYVVSFSLGKRSCLGDNLARQEIFLFLTGLLQHFDILPPEGHSKVDCTEVVGLAITPSPFLIRLIPRIR